MVEPNDVVVSQHVETKDGIETKDDYNNKGSDGDPAIQVRTRRPKRMDDAQSIQRERLYNFDSLSSHASPEMEVRTARTRTNKLRNIASLQGGTTKWVVDTSTKRLRTDVRDMAITYARMKRKNDQMLAPTKRSKTKRSAHKHHKSNS